MLLPATTGFGEATLVTVSSAAAVVPTTVDAVALLLLGTSIGDYLRVGDVAACHDRIRRGNVGYGELCRSGRSHDRGCSSAVVARNRIAHGRTYRSSVSDHRAIRGA